VRSTFSMAQPPQSLRVRLTKYSTRALVLTLTICDADRLMYEALRTGATGFLLKPTQPDKLVSGVVSVAAGESLLASSPAGWSRSACADHRSMSACRVRCTT
jgi:DNA-binding NarL/FixJ family response regulator